MKQTAIEYLESKMTNYLQNLYKSEIEQAKEIEKQQISRAYFCGYDEDLERSGEQYYQETYKQKL